MVLSTLAVGDRIKFAEERQRYTVRAVSEDGRYAICTKPFNAKRTVLYTIVDFEEEVRGPDDRVFSLGYETDDQIATNMALLVVGEMYVSRRYRVTLNIDRDA